MGLDLVEFFLVVEEEFQVDIRDEDAASLQTPGDVAAYLCSRMTLDQEMPSLLQTRLSRLREIVSRDFAVRPENITGDLPLASFLGPDTRRGWYRLQQGLGVDLPPLQRPPVIRVIFQMLFPLVVAFYVWQGYKSWLWTMLVAGGLAWVTTWLTRPLATRIPADLAIVSQLLPFLPIPPQAFRHHEDVLERVIELASLQFAIPIARINQHSRFARDLNVD